MNRYLSSFTITAIIYTVLVAGMVILYPKDENISDKTIDKPNLISVNMLAQPEVVKEVKKPEPKKVVKQKPKPKKKPEVKPKKEPKPEPKKKPKPKPVEKKLEPLKKEEIEPEVEEKPEPEVEQNVKEEIVKEVVKKEPTLQKPAQQPLVQRPVITKEQSKITQDEIKAKQNLFFAKVRKRIDQNKSYPRVARRRGIEGEVEVSFFLQKDGNVKNIEFLSGKRIFKKSIEKAILDSFPMEVDSSLFNFPKKFKITVKYILS